MNKLFPQGLPAIFLLLILSTAVAEDEPVLPPSSFLHPPAQSTVLVSPEEEKHPMDWSKTLVSRDIAGRQLSLDGASWDKQYRDGQSAYFFGLYAQAFELWMPLARAGYADAQASLGWLYQSGLNGTKDLKQALHWYQQAAAQQQPVALNNLGVMYEQGIAVAVDTQKALELYRQSARQQYRFAQYNLGALLAKGNAAQQAEAITWLRSAATQGVEKARTLMQTFSEK